MACIPLPTVVRIKRKLGDETSETIIVSSKRKKFLSPESEKTLTDLNICKTVMKRLATVKNVESLETDTKNIIKNEVKQSELLKSQFKLGTNISPKDLVQKKSKECLSAVRYKLICAKRNITTDDIETKMNFCLYDALHAVDDCFSQPSTSAADIKVNEPCKDVIVCNGIPLESEKVEYVYDLYYTEIPMEIASWIDNICEISRPNAIEYLTNDQKADDAEDQFEDEDDENEESNWRNDYPDEDELDSSCDDLCEKVTRCGINDESDDSFYGNEDSFDSMNEYASDDFHKHLRENF